jgi:copper chaperone NosL
MKALQTLLLIVGLLIVLPACADGPRDIEIGAEECAHCRMRVSEEAFAAQLRTQQGRVHVFDSIECMAEFVADNPEVSIRGMWVTDFDAPGEWLSAESAHYLRSDELRSPMGLGLSAYAGPAPAETAQAEYGGDVVDWEGVRDLVAGSTVAPARGARHAH